MYNSITLLGSSSGRNAGDAALVGGIMNAIDNACGRQLHYEVPTFRPEFVRNSYPNKVKPISMLPWHGTAGMLGFPTYNSIMRSDLSLVFDNMLFDRALYNPLFNFMSTVALFLPWAKRRGKALGCYNIGAGPVHTQRGREMLRDIIELMDFVSVRDRDSLDLLREIGVKNPNVIVTADAAIGVPGSDPGRVDSILERLGLSTDPDILAINVNAYLNTWSGLDQRALSRSEFASTYAAALDQVVQELKVPILFVCTQHHDVSITNEVRAAMKVPAKTALISNVEYSHHDLKGVLGRVSLLFAMRLHASVLGSSALAPSIALGFQKKVNSYYDCLGLSDYVMSFKDFSTTVLVRHILRGWSDRAAIKRTLVERIPQLAAEADRSAQIVALMSRGISAQDAIAKVISTPAPVSQVAAG